MTKDMFLRLYNIAFKWELGTKVFLILDQKSGLDTKNSLDRMLKM